MLNKKNIFFEKKILIYGLGKSGISVYRFLKEKNKLFLYDDKKVKIRKKILNYNKLKKINFDYIIISPEINIEKCKLSNFLKKKPK